MSDQPAGESKAGQLLHRSPRDLLQRMGRLVRKELSEILRDRRTIITLVLMPLLLYPLLSMAFQRLLLEPQPPPTPRTEYFVGVASEEEKRFLEEFRHLVGKREALYQAT